MVKRAKEQRPGLKNTAIFVLTRWNHTSGMVMGSAGISMTAAGLSKEAVWVPAPNTKEELAVKSSVPGTWLCFPSHPEFEFNPGNLPLNNFCTKLIIVSKLPNIFDYFPDSDKISAFDLAPFLPEKYDLKLLENELGNRLLYPYRIPVTEKELRFDLAILHAALKANASTFYKQPTQNGLNSKIIIPEGLLPYFPNLLTIIWVYINCLNPIGIIGLYLQTEVGAKNLGTLIRPQIQSSSGQARLPDGQAVVEVSQESAAAPKQKYQIKMGSTLIIPAPNTHVDIIFDCPGAKIANRNPLTAHVVGGQLGVVVDLRGAKPK